MPLPLRDQLAIDRTALANERTILAYGRTALGLLGAGAGAIELFEAATIILLGWIFVAAAVLVMAIGLASFVRVRRKIAEARIEEGEEGRGPGAWGPEA